MKKIISIFVMTAALLTAAPGSVSASARSLAITSRDGSASSGGVILAFKLDAGCIKVAAQQRDKAINNAYADFRKATEKARSERKEGLILAGKDKAKKKKVESDYRAALAKAGADLNTSKKNIAALFKAEVGLCKK